MSQTSYFLLPLGVLLRHSRIICKSYIITACVPYQQRLFWAALSVLEFTVYNDAHYGKLNDNINNFIEQIRLARTTFKFPASKVFEDYESLKLSNNSEFKKDIEKKQAILFDKIYS